MKNSYIIALLLITIAFLLSTSCKKEESGDGTIPEIIVLGVNPMYWALDIPYVDQGATAFDISDSGDTTDLTSSIEVQINVDVTIKGDYTVSYNVKDASGLSAEEKIRNVKVVDGK